jgi:hypothetical protein
MPYPIYARLNRRSFRIKIKNQKKRILWQH